MPAVIQFNNVSKRYYLGSQKAHLRYLLPSFVQRTLSGGLDDSDSNGTIWALKDVSFEVQPGEVLGLIGPNGAGKTTTLSLLAGITSPTNGLINVKGRVGALIQLGAGFHHELTGRENIYLNGVIMGLSKRKISQIIDEIIHFAELEKFIDTPIKRYSSGMYVRLGFSVAVHIDPEILLIDEVLAVGDASFKAKCYSKIRELRESGITVVLVSHELSQIKNLCDRAILIKNKILDMGDVDEVVQAYYQLVFGGDGDQIQNSELDRQVVRLNSSAFISKVEFRNQNGEITYRFNTGDSLKILIYYQANDVIPLPSFGVSIHSADGFKLVGTNTKVDNFQIDKLEGCGTMEFALPDLSLLPGTYQVSIGLHDQYMGFYDRKLLAYRFHIVSGPTTTGVILPPHQWKLDQGI